MGKLRQYFVLEVHMEDWVGEGRVGSILIFIHFLMDGWMVADVGEGDDDEKNLDEGKEDLVAL